MSANEPRVDAHQPGEAPDWWIYRGTGRPMYDIDLTQLLPPPPPWRDFGGPLPSSDGQPPEDDGEASRRLGSKFHLTEQHIDLHELDMVNASLYLRRPLLLTGKPGAGKSALAYRIARAAARPGAETVDFDAHDSELRLVPLRRHRPVAGGADRPAAIRPSGRSLDRGFIRLGPLGTAFLPRRLPRVLLIDELDKSEADLPNNLLGIFEDGEFVIDELARIRHSTHKVTVHTADPNETATVTDGRIRCYTFPIVIMTNDGEREFPPAFLRRALQLEIKDPNVEQLAAMVANHLLDPHGLHRDALVREFEEKSRAEGGIPADRPLDAVYLATSGGCKPNRKMRALRDDAMVLDEQITADQVVQIGRWWPVTRPRMERWLDLTLVVDRSPLMTLWQAQVAAFTEMLSRLGAFRTIQIRLLEVVQIPDGSAVPMPRGGTVETPARDPAEIVDASGRRVVLLLTDGVSDTWRPDVLLPMLAMWGRTMPVSVVHLLPQWLWERGRIRTHRVELSAHRPTRPNSRWTFDLPDARLEPDPASLTRPDTVPVPVIEMRPRWLRWWSALITGESRRPVTGTVLLATSEAPSAESVSLSAPDHVRQFRSQASPPALRLATLLAAVPAHLDVAQLIRQRFVPEAGTDHLAELLLSGLLYPADPEDHEFIRDSRAFAFPEAVRELLLSGARRSETVGVIQAAAAEFSERLPVLARLRDAIAAPTTLQTRNRAGQIQPM